MLPLNLFVALIFVVGQAEASPQALESDDLNETTNATSQDSSLSTRLADEIQAPQLRSVVGEVLARNPAVARANARARAASRRAPQVKALPDPSAQLTAFLESPETRVGPQRVGVSVSQSIPWLTKLSLAERAALLHAGALLADVEAQRLTLVTEARRLAYELAFVARLRAISERYLQHLIQHEEIARARYATGAGLGQDVIKLQAAITQAESELLAIDTREASLSARLNRLRDRSASTPLPRFSLPDDLESSPIESELVSKALDKRPEVKAADLDIERGNTLVELARKRYKPDFRAGLSYTLVDRRRDRAGRLNPPEGNGDDILGAQVGVSIPIWRKKLDAGVHEAIELRSLAEEAKRELVAGIRATVGDLAQRIPLAFEQLKLLDDLLIAQAEETLESAKSAYVSSSVNALDLLDAEHVLFNAEKAAARARADWAIATARLEGAIAQTFTNTTPTEVSQ